MEQCGVIAATGLVALMDWEDKIYEDHMNAAFLAHELWDIKSIDVDHHSVETNILRFKVDKKVLKALKTDHRGFVRLLKEEHSVLCNPDFDNAHIRFVTHRNVSREQCEKAIKAVKSLVAKAGFH